MKTLMSAAWLLALTLLTGCGGPTEPTGYWLHEQTFPPPTQVDTLGNVIP